MPKATASQFCNPNLSSERRIDVELVWARLERRRQSQMRRTEFFVAQGSVGVRSKRDMGLDVTPLDRNLRTRVTLVRLEAEDFVRHPCRHSPDEHLRLLSEARDIRLADEHGLVFRAHSRCARMMPFKYGKQRGYLLDWVLFHTKPHVYSVLEPDQELDREYLKDSRHEPCH
jgi:hypothetical protein